MQKKKLVTDILIEEYQKELEIVKMYLKDLPEGRTLLNKKSMLQDFIEALQSLRQQEVQNVIDAYREAGVTVACHILDNNKNTPTPEQYFAQTFEQKGGENEKKII
tara:strand:- start:35267 stop:35584 length:318 start_codon:yes stop_codon:yes gene_type:complete